MMYDSSQWQHAMQRHDYYSALLGTYDDYVLNTTDNLQYKMHANMQGPRRSDCP